MSPIVWILIGVVILAVCLHGKGNRKDDGSRENPTRIDRMHYYDPDDHECSVCGARFEGKSMVCPKCGARFIGTKDEDDEFVEEMVLWEDDEE